jgi:rhodanese-related sulfurtransferase
MDIKKLAVAMTITATALLVFLLAARADPPVCGPAGCTLAAAPEGTPQATCPVMGRKINRKLYADVKGYRVYVCCGGCVGAVKANPDKFIKKIKDNGETPLATPSPASPKCKACNAAKGSAACAAACAKAAAKPASKPAADEATVNTAGLAILLRARVPLALLDARSGKFDDGRRIPGAKTLSATATAEQAAAFIETKDTLVVTYCSNLKCPASSYLAKRLKALGYTNVIEYPHGIDGWAAAGNTVAKAAK